MARTDEAKLGCLMLVLAVGLACALARMWGLSALQTIAFLFLGGVLSIGLERVDD